MTTLLSARASPRRIQDSGATSQSETCRAYSVHSMRFSRMNSRARSSPSPARITASRSSASIASSRFCGSSLMPFGGELLGRQLVQVDVVRLARIELAVDAVEARGDQRRRDEIRVAAGIRQAHFEPAMRDAHAGRAVVVAVGDVGRRPGRSRQRAADDQPLVGVDGRRRDRAEGARVREDAAQEMIGHVRQAHAALVASGRGTRSSASSSRPRRGNARRCRCGSRTASA